MPPAAAAGIVMKIASARWLSRAWCSYELKMAEYVARRRPLLIIPLAAPENGVWELEATGFYPNQAVAKFVLRGRHTDSKAQETLYTQYLGFLTPVSVERKNDDAEMYPLLQIEKLHMITELGCTFRTDYIPIVPNTSGLDIVFHGTVNTSDELRWVCPRWHLQYVAFLTVLAILYSVG
jgi:hypothetical protein